MSDHTLKLEIYYLTKEQCQSLLNDILHAMDNNNWDLAYQIKFGSSVEAGFDESS